MSVIVFFAKKNSNLYLFPPRIESEDHRKFSYVCHLGQKEDIFMLFE